MIAPRNNKELKEFVEVLPWLIIVVIAFSWFLGRQVDRALDRRGIYPQGCELLGDDTGRRWVECDVTN